jgi:glycosyltransferase involved in cell wall biosynthesis
MPEKITINLRNKSAVITKASQAPLVSVVITTKNEERNIKNCLLSITAQTYKNIEIILVDNFSTDQTYSIAKEYIHQFAQIGPERSSQRNFGMINLSKGEYVLYVDADMILSPLLIQECVIHCMKEEIKALHIPEIILGKSFFSKVRRFERSFYDGTVIDGARFIEKELFCKVGGFDEILFQKGSGEDWDLDKKIKKYELIGMLRSNADNDCQLNPELKRFIEERGVKCAPTYAGIFHNESDFDLIKYLQKKGYYATGFNGYISKWGKEDPDIKKQFGLFYRYIIVFIEYGKWKKIVGNMQLFIGMIFLKILVGIIFLISKCKK